MKSYFTLEEKAEKLGFKQNGTKKVTALQHQLSNSDSPKDSRGLKSSTFYLLLTYRQEKHTLRV